MPKLFSSIRSLWPSRQTMPGQEADPDWEPAISPFSSKAEPVMPPPVRNISAPPETPANMAELKADEIAATRIALDTLMQEVFADLNQNRANQESLLKTYEAQSDVAMRRTLACQYKYVQAKAGQLEERHEELTLQLRLWDSVAIQVEKAQWQEGKLNRAKQPAVELSSLQAMMQSTIAQGEQARQQIQDTLDMVDAAAGKAKVRRDFGVQATMAEMDQQLAQQREAKALAQQHELADLANGVDAMLNKPLASTSKQAVSMKGGA